MGLIIVANGIIIGRDVTSQMAGPSQLVTHETGSSNIIIQPLYCPYEGRGPQSPASFH